MTKTAILSDFIEHLSLRKNKSAIIDGAQAAWANCNPKISEPLMVKSFILDPGTGVDYLNRHVATTLNKSNSRFVVKFAGVYCHQRPYVVRQKHNILKKKTTSKTHSCELSDLAFLVVYVDHKKTVLSARASFFQAKKKASIDNPTQRWLYDYDDKFAYKSRSFWKSTSKATSMRTLPNWHDGRSSALQYLILPPAGKPTVYLSPWNVTHSHKFGFFLYRLMTLADGKRYDVNKICRGGWSSIVNDVLRMAKGHMKGVNRGSPDLDTIVDYFNDFKDHELYCYENDDQKGAPPFVIAIIQDTEEPGRSETKG